MKALLILAAAGTMLASGPLTRAASAADYPEPYGWHRGGYAPHADWHGQHRRHHHHHRHAYGSAGFDDPLDFSPDPVPPELAIHRDLPRPRGVIYNVPCEQRRHWRHAIRANG